MDKLQRNKTTAAQAIAIEDGKDHPFHPGETHSTKYFDLLRQRRALPVSAKRQEFLDAYHQHQVIVLSSEPGSERAIQIPQFIFFDEWEGNAKIACTHTRRIEVASAAERTAAEMDVHVGVEVGFAMRFDQLRHDQTELLYMTDRTLLEVAGKQPNFNDFACIIIDEAHERALATDMLLGLLKVAISQRTDLKSSGHVGYATHFELVGQNHPVQITYIKEPILEVFSAALNLAKHIHEKEDDGDIFVFFSSAAECEEACLLLRKNTRDLEVLPLYSERPGNQKSRVLQKRTKRVCVCATNIAEASMIVVGIVHIIDLGKAKHNGYNPRMRLDTLITGPISQAAARLRADCAGRNKPGFCYRLYTYKSFREEMKAFSTPKIHEDGISEFISKLKAMGFDNVAEFDFVDPPHHEILFRGLEDLGHILEILALAALDGSNIYLRPHGVRQWCFDAFLNHSVLDEVARVRQQLKELFHLLFPDWRAPNTTPFIDPNYEFNTRKALTRTFYYLSDFRDPAGIDQYRVVRANWQAGIHPDSHQVGANHECIIFGNLTYSGIQYMSNVTAVEPEWLAELDFFKEKNWLRKPNGVYRMPILQTTILPLQPKKDPKNTPE
ncbi:putative ATP-binding PRP16 [Fusarium globosum]|uniref:RNA helicase n=1 Tax=Fusarium globosum TaxID=78864 RepID=A0A8H5XSA9_9HYPO|nr:putative ATP-binding PRP16 [Fusarium globosum]